MTKLRLGMIGAGAWCVASHLPRLEQHRDSVEFAAVNRRDPALLETVRSRFGFASAHTDYRGVLAADPDIVVVASPVRWHHEHAKAALEAGAHVLVEKPFTLDPGEARDLVATAAANGRHLIISLGWHYKDIVIGAKRLMEEGGGVGTVEHVSIVMSSTTREAFQGVQPSFSSDQDEGGFVSEESVPELTPRPETLVDPTLSGGGYAQAQLSHALGLGLWLSGLRAAEVFAMMSSPLDTSVEFHDALSVRFDAGAIGSVSGGSSHLGHNANKHHLEVQIIGSEGQLHVDLCREQVTRFRGPDTTVSLPLEPDAGLYDCSGPIDALVALARGEGVPNRSPGELGVRTVEIVEAAYRSAASGRVETVS